MESHLLHCRTFTRTPRSLVAFEDKKEVPKTASETVPDGPLEASKGLARLNKQVESKVSRSEVGIEIPTRAQFQEIWRNAPEALREQLREPVDEMELGLRRLDVYQEVEKLAKDKGEVYAAVKQYEWAARRFNQIIGSTVFPENLTNFDWKNSRDAKEEERRFAFAKAREVYEALNINYTDNPNLDPAPAPRPGVTPEKVEVRELGKADIKALAKTETAQIKNILGEIDHSKKLNLSLSDCKELLESDLAPVRDPAVEKGDRGRESILDKLRARIVMYAWDEHVSPLIREKGDHKPKFDLRPASRFPEMIATNVAEEYRLKGQIFELVPKAGVSIDPDEDAKAKQAAAFLHANWKQVVYIYGKEPEIVPMLENIDVQRNNRKQTEIWTDVKNVPEANAILKQPFSRTILSSPAGILLTILGYFMLDAKGKSLLTKFLIGSFAVEKAGGTEGLAALAHKLGDQIPWAKQAIQDVMGGQVNLKAKEYTRSAFENWTGLKGIQKETRDWMLRDSDGLTDAKKLGIYIIVNDQPVQKVREMINKKPPNSPGSIGEYIEQWKVEGKGSWRDKPGTSSWQRVKSISQKLATGTANAAGKGEKYFEEFLFGGIMGITPEDVENFFKAKIEDDKGQPTKVNPMRATIEDTTYDGQQFEDALRRKFPDGASRNVKTDADTSTADGEENDDAEDKKKLQNPEKKVAPLTKPSEATKSEDFFGHALVGMKGISEENYDDSEQDWFNVDFKKGTTTYHALKSRKTADEGLWVEALDGDGKSDADTYSLFFPDLATFQHRFDRTVEIMDMPDGKVALQKLFSDGLALLTPGTWKLAKIEEFPADANITAKNGWFSVEIETTASADENKKLKLYIQAGSDKFQVVNAKGEGVTKKDGTYEFETGEELDQALKLSEGTSTAPGKPTINNLDKIDRSTALGRKVTRLAPEILSSLSVAKAEVKEVQKSAYTIGYSEAGREFSLIFGEAAGKQSINVCVSTFNEWSHKEDISSLDPDAGAAGDAAVIEALKRHIEYLSSYSLATLKRNGELTGSNDALWGYTFTKAPLSAFDASGHPFTSILSVMKDKEGKWKYALAPASPSPMWLDLSSRNTLTPEWKEIGDHARYDADAARLLLYLSRNPNEPTP